jgi:hypothetical protein
MARMGRTPKGWAKAAAKLKKENDKKKASNNNSNSSKGIIHGGSSSSSTLQVGRVTTNVVANVYGPLLLQRANQVAEGYASALLEYEDAVQACEVQASSVTSDEEVKTQTSDELLTETCSAPPASPKKPALFATQQSLDELQELVVETSRAVSSAGTWKARANAAKFERLLDEKYGILRPFLTHPQVEVYMKWLQRKHAMGNFSVFRQGDPPIALHTSIIILFMMHRNKVRMDALILSAIFMLVGLQPWALVCLVSCGVHWRNRRKTAFPVGATLSSPKQMVPIDPYYNESNQHDILKQPVGHAMDETQLAKECGENDSAYDVIIVGDGGADTLYCGALLARMGRRVLVLSSKEDASGCVTLRDPPSNNNKFTEVPFDVTDSNLGRLASQQRLLAPALSTTSDVQGGVRFATIGTEADGFSYCVLSVPGMGGGGITTTTVVAEDGTERLMQQSSDSSTPFVLRAGGIDVIAQDASLYLGDGWHTDMSSTNSAIARYLAQCRALHADSTQFYYNKLFNEQEKALASLLGGGEAWSSSTTYGGAAIRNAGEFLKKVIPLNPHVRSLAAALGCPNEDLKPSQTSFAVHLSNIAAVTDPAGFAYPVGGPRSLCRALQQTIEQNGGSVVTNITAEEFLFEDDDAAVPSEGKQEETKTEVKPKEKKGPRCKGIKLRGGTNLFVDHTNSDKGTTVGGAVISFLGMIPTFLKVKAEDRDKGGVPMGFVALTERRPQLHILFALEGSSTMLNLPAADWVRLPSSSLPRDTVDPVTNQVIPGNVGGDDWNNDDSSTSNPAAAEGDEGAVGESRSTSAFGLDTTGRAGGRKGHMKFHTGQSYLKISFPSVKDPSWSERHPDVNTCVATIDADDDFCRMISSKPTFAMKTHAGAGEKDRLIQRVIKDVVHQFPQLEGKIAASEVHGPFRAGLSQNPERFAVKGTTPKTPYPGLFLGGKDLTVDSFSGTIVSAWLTANAVLGYGVLDAVVLQKNITTDLECMMPKVSSSSEQMAVPFTRRDPESKLDPSMAKGGDGGREDAASAEPSKET